MRAEGRRGEGEDQTQVTVSVHEGNTENIHKIYAFYTVPGICFGSSLSQGFMGELIIGNLRRNRTR